MALFQQSSLELENICLDKLVEMHALLIEQREAVIHMQSNRVLEIITELQIGVADLTSEIGTLKKLGGGASHWKIVFDRKVTVCADLWKSNQRLLTHSMKNLELLTEDLKRLLSSPSLYSNVGKSTQNLAPGKMVAAQL